MVPASLLNTLLLALAVAANPIVVQRSLITLSMTKNINFTASNIVRHDQLRAKALKAKGKARTIARADPDASLQSDGGISSQIDNHAFSYIASVGVGNPAKSYNLVVDTGSSNTWVGANQAYTSTSTSTQTSDSVSVSYGSGSFSGTEYTDQVTLASDLVVNKQSIGVASTSSGFSGVDGILGMGPVDLTVGTLSPDTGTSIPTVTDNLFSAGAISADTFAISFEPITSSSAEQLNGEITWGGTDSSKFTGSIAFTPITSTAPASTFWGIEQSITYGSSTSILSTTAGIVDTGTTLLLISSDAFSRYQDATGAVTDSTTGLLSITSSQFAKLQSLFFNINGVTFEMTANAQIWPRNLNTATGGVAGNIYLVVGDLQSQSGQGLDFINGQAFLERFYAVFDNGNKQVGLATTAFTTATTN